MEIIFREAGGWDSGWVQAIGSIVAIFVGFAYVALQNRHSTKLEEKRHRAFCFYIADLAGDLEAHFVDAVKTFADASETGSNVRSANGGLMAQTVCNELLTVSPNDCGSSSFTKLTRKIALFGHAFDAIGREAAASGEIISPQTVTQLRAHLHIIQEVMPALRALAGLAADHRNSS